MIAGGLRSLVAVGSGTGTVSHGADEADALHRKIRNVVINFIFGLTSIQPNAVVRIRHGIAIRREEQRESNEPLFQQGNTRRLGHGTDPAACQ